MARDVNWWLMSLAFLLGLLLTLALTIRKVTREVPVGRTGVAAAGGSAAAGGATAKVHAVAEKVHGDVHAVAEKVHGDVHAVAEKVHGDVHAAAEKVHGDVQAAAGKVHDDVHTLVQKVETVESRGIIEAVPYGAGSIRVTRRSSAPAGYRLKGVKETGRYYTPESPDFDAIETELWFLNEDSAEKAGFVRWNGTEAHRLLSAEAAAVVHEGHHVAADTVITEGDRVSAEIVVTEHHGSSADSTLVIIDDGIPEAESRIKIIGVD